MNPPEPLVSPDRAPAKPHAPLAFLGVACAVGVSSLYLNQPLLGEMGQNLHASPQQIGLVAMATQVGYACGLLSFVPLGDVLERRALIMRLFGAVSIALLLNAVAPGIVTLTLASTLVGLFASVTHVVLPIAPDLVEHEERGRAIGIVMTGLLLGVLLARTFAGWVSRIDGWRWVFVAAAVINAAFVPLVWRFMPLLPAKQNLRYRDTMRSLRTLYREQPLLREASLVGALVFAAFSCFWTTLAFMLQAHFGMGAGIAGSFGLVGAGGALIAARAGRVADRKGARWVASAGLSILFLCYLVLWAAVSVSMSTAFHMAALVVGVILLDIGTQTTQIANQTRIFGLVPSARSRLNTVYMVHYFGGAAVGSWLSSIAWTHWGWTGVCVLALGFMALAAVRHLTGLRDQPGRAHRSDEGEALAGA